jgi:hypothetical protein
MRNNNNTAQSNPKPNFAPICKNVTIPEGSSSAAPVIKPGPSDRNILIIDEKDNSFMFMAIVLLNIRSISFYLILI